MVATTTLDPAVLSPDDRVYAVPQPDGDVRLFQRDPEAERSPDRYYLDRVQDTVVHVAAPPDDAGTEAWTVSDVAGEFEWERHPLWIQDRLDRVEWQPVEPVDMR